MKDYVSKEIDFFIEGLHKDFSTMTKEEKTNYYSFLIIKSIYDILAKQNDKEQNK